MKQVSLNVTLTLILIVMSSTAVGVTSTARQEQKQPHYPAGSNDASQVYLVAASRPPQVRADSDAHWDWLEEKWPNAEEMEMVRIAATDGDAEAQFRLALMYDTGHGVELDQAKAAKWLHKAAEQGLAKAQYNLAVAYDNGRGVSQDYAEAVRWYRAAAEQGYTSAQKNLGVKYGLGQGVPQSDIEAYIWSAIAAQSGDEGAGDNRNLAANRLSAEELEAARKWAAKRYNAIQQKQTAS